MVDTFQQRFQSNPSFEFRDGIFYQVGFDNATEFTKTYLDIRQREQRLYDDETVLRLPETPLKMNSSEEWLIRKRSANRLERHLSGREGLKVVEVGCGNGWLINYLSKTLQLDFAGVDINELELRQAARIFGSQNRSFVHADILSAANTAFKADIFILAGAVQYFSDFHKLITSLIKLLNPGGEIHIVDSPFYNEDDIKAAGIRSKEYFTKTGVEAMEKYYFFHGWAALKEFSFDVLYHPSSALNRMRRLVSADSPFPWIKIENGKGNL